MTFLTAMLYPAFLRQAGRRETRKSEKNSLVPRSCAMILLLFLLSGLGSSTEESFAEARPRSILCKDGLTGRMVGSGLDCEGNGTCYANQN